MKIRIAFAASALVVFASYAQAQIPYPNVGTIAPSNTFTASSTGDITGYFVQGGAASGGGASDLDFVQLFDVTTATSSGWLFDNQTTGAGASADFGSVHAGDTLEFELLNVSLGDLVFSSVAADSADGDNHAYSVAWGGGTLNGALIPAGTYIGMEDEPASFSDFNYNDDSFVFTDVSSTPTIPEPSSFYLLGSGLVGLVEYGRRKLRA
jgi:hypothetical protein